MGIYNSRYTYVKRLSSDIIHFIDAIQATLRRGIKSREIQGELLNSLVATGGLLLVIDCM